MECCQKRVDTTLEESATDTSETDEATKDKDTYDIFWYGMREDINGF